MRICVITPYFYPHAGGSQRYIEELYTTMRQLKPGLEVDVLCYNTDHASSEEEYQGLHIYRLPCWEILRGQFAIPNYVALMQLLKKLKTKYGKYDLLNSHTRFFENSWWAPFAARYLGAKSCLTDHCAGVPVHDSALVAFASELVDKIIVPLVAKHYDQITVVSRATQRYLASLGLKNSQVIYGGVDTDLFVPQQTKKIRHLPGIKRTFGPQNIIISFIGRMIRSKGPQIVKEELTKWLQNEHVFVVLAGDGPLLPEIQQGLQSERVFVLGQLKKKQVAELLNQTDIFVHPSTHHEGFPMILAEAGAAGCAIVATNQGGTSELIKSGQTGMLTDLEHFGDDVENMIRNSVKGQKLGKLCREKVLRDFQWKNSALQFYELICKS